MSGNGQKAIFTGVKGMTEDKNGNTVKRREGELGDRSTGGQRVSVGSKALLK